MRYWWNFRPPPFGAGRGRGWGRWGVCILAFFVIASSIAFDRWVATAQIPPLTPEVSTTILDREDRLLRAYTVADGRWRLPVEVADVDPGFIAQLIAYEDKRFRHHAGVDPVASLRALGQFIANGRVISGGSTLTMQVARLLEEAPSGSLTAKLRQTRLALALERRLTKDEILRLYLTIAPYGGNIEGVRAASLSYFGKEPRRLTPGQAALLVALPQSPEARRPDRAPDTARAARDRVLTRLEEKGALPADEARAARSEPTPRLRFGFPLTAPHLADRLRGQGGPMHRATIDRDVQKSLEALLRDRVGKLSRTLSGAIIVADHKTGDVLASVGSPGLFQRRRRGFVDMTRAIRSPGSTLKPLIYGLGFEAGLAHPETLIEDRPIDFGGYVPGNFDRSYSGTVSIREALHRSLNIPAVAVLDSVGPAKLMARMRRAGVEPHLPPGRAPGLAIGLGGVGVSLHDLVTLYAGIARGGQPVMLRERVGTRCGAAGTRPLPARREEGWEGGRADFFAARPPSLALPPQAGRGDAGCTRSASPILTPNAAWQVADILASAPAPHNATEERLAFKTGTSYGHRDAWAIGFDGRHVIGVWLGRADAASARGILGLDTAAPLLFEAFSRLKPRPDPLAPPPPSVLTVTNAELPPPLRRFRHPGMRGGRRAPEPQIAFPPDGSTLDLGLARAEGVPLTMKLRHGAPPFTWLVDGRKLDVSAHDREVTFTPDGPGFVSISVIDRTGAAARAKLFLE